MRFYPKRFYRGTIYLGGHLIFPELKWVLNDVVPPSSRGNRKTSYGLSTFAGGMVETDYEYDKVTFTFAYSLRIKMDPESLKKSDEFVLLDGFPITDLPPPPPPSESDFDGAIKAEIAILRWNDRTCAQDYNSVRPDYHRVAEIEQRFGQPQKIYSAGSHSSMSAEFAADGQVCQIWVYPRRVSGNGNYLGNKLEYGEVWSFLNSFVSPQDRGLKQELNFGTTATGGGCASTTYPYENVLFTFMTAFPLQKYSDSEHPLRKEEFRFSLPYPAQPDIKDRLPSKYDFRRTDDAEIVTVRWLQRTCGAF